jgi:hypothetical protein
MRDKKHGQGTYRFSAADGDRLAQICDWYEGQWKDGSMHGRGVCVPTPKMYTLSQCELNGANRYHHESGDVYDGEFLDNEMSGSGTYTTADGNKIQGSSLPRLPDFDASACCSVTRRAPRYVLRWQLCRRRA